MQPLSYTPLLHSFLQAYRSLQAKPGNPVPHAGRGGSRSYWSGYMMEGPIGFWNKGEAGVALWTGALEEWPRAMCFDLVEHAGVVHMGACRPCTLAWPHTLLWQSSSPLSHTSQARAQIAGAQWHRDSRRHGIKAAAFCHILGCNLPHPRPQSATSQAKPASRRCCFHPNSTACKLAIAPHTKRSPAGPPNSTEISGFLLSVLAAEASPPGRPMRAKTPQG